ncbi:Rieske (2Fe-2S) protein [Planctomycetota bacterium]|nr:Rieske (2Fe-2S) protein [Planctomycetota bacterium]
MTDTPDNSRREFIRIALIGGVAMISAGAASGAVLLPKQTAKPDNTKHPLVPMSKLPDIKIGKPLEVQISLAHRDAWKLRTSTQHVYLLREAEADAANSFTALSSICPHAGCRIELEDKKFHCHCHGAKFDLTGKVTEDPSPRDMDSLELVEVKEFKGEAWLFVNWAEFETGTTDKRMKGQA